MRESIPVILLPYLISILVKLSSLFLDRSFILDSLEKLSAIRVPYGETFALTSDSRKVVADYVEFAYLRSSVILTTLTSLLSAAIITHGGTGSPYALIACVVFGFIMLWWVLPRPVPYFHTENSIGIRRGTVAILAFCAYDAILAIISVLAVIR